MSSSRLKKVMRQVAVSALLSLCLASGYAAYVYHEAGPQLPSSHIDRLQGKLAAGGMPTWQRVHTAILLMAQQWRESGDFVGTVAVSSGYNAELLA